MTAFTHFQASVACPWATQAAAEELYRAAVARPAWKDEEETRIWCLPDGTGSELFLKEYRIPARRRWMASFVRSRAGREWRALEAMSAASLPVAPPCFAVERRRGPWLESSLLATTSLGEVRPLPLFLKQENSAQGLAACFAVGHLVRRLHEADFGHFRLQAKNLMVLTGGAPSENPEEIQMALLDAPYSCHWTRSPLPDRIRRVDLEDLCGIHSCLNQEQIDAVLQAYREQGDPLPDYRPGKRSRLTQKLRRIAYYLLAIWSGHRP